MFTDESQVPEDTSTETIQEDQAEVVVEEAVEETQETEESHPDWEAEAKKWKAIANRAAKKQEKVPSTEAGLSEYDILALKNSNITEKEDLDTVKEYSKKLGLSIADALSDKYVKTVLADKAEERRTARATETRSPRGIAKNTGEDLLRKAEQTGEVPTSEDALRAIAEARLARKKR